MVYCVCTHKLFVRSEVMKVNRVLSMILAVLLFALPLASCDDTTVDSGAPDTSNDPPVSVCG